MRYPNKFVPLALCFLLGACSHTASTVATSAPINWTAEAGKRVILIDPDVELSELTAGGVTEARADWTQTGKTFIKQDIASTLQAKGIATTSADNITDPHEAQLVKLHTALGLSIRLSAAGNLPTKKEQFRLDLGPRRRRVAQSLSR